MTYHNHRVEPYFSFVKSGHKTIEGRLKRGWYRNVKPDNHVIVHNQDETDSVEIIVKAVRNYPSIRKMLESEQLSSVLPDVKSIDEGIEVYKKFYTEDEEKKFGVVAIEVERIVE